MLRIVPWLLVLLLGQGVAPHREEATDLRLQQQDAVRSCSTRPHLCRSLAGQPTSAGLVPPAAAPPAPVASGDAVYGGRPVAEPRLPLFRAPAAPRAPPA